MNMHNMLHGYGNAAWTWMRTCSMDMDIEKDVDNWISSIDTYMYCRTDKDNWACSMEMTCSMEMDMQHVNGL
jgi:hypothetical protein